MREKDLQFDKKKHVIYSNHAKKVIQTRLVERYGVQKGLAIWEGVQRKYVEFLRDMPYVGGKRSPHSGTYDSILVFAYYTVVPEKPTLGELQGMNAEIFMSGFKTLGKVFNLNRPTHLKLAAKIFQNVGEKDRQLNCPMGFQMENRPFDRENGVIFYRFTRCPNADMAARLGLSHIMPAFCNCDYIGLAEIGATLIRRDTLARGNECDYTIVGSKNLLTEKHLRRTDENGFWVNE